MKYEQPLTVILSCNNVRSVDKNTIWIKENYMQSFKENLKFDREYFTSFFVKNKHFLTIADDDSGGNDYYDIPNIEALEKVSLKYLFGWYENGKICFGPDPNDEDNYEYYLEQHQILKDKINYALNEDDGFAAYKILEAEALDSYIIVFELNHLRSV